MNPFVQSLLISDQTTGSDSSGDLGETINQSLRFHSGANLTRNLQTAFPGSFSATGTCSAWWKFANILSDSTSSVAWRADNLGGSDRGMILGKDGFIKVRCSGGDVDIGGKYRDYSGWYHIVQQSDGTNLKVWVNGDLKYNATTPWGSGSNSFNDNWDIRTGNEAGNEFNFYLAEFNFLDGTAADQDQFGRYNEDGVWVPIKIDFTAAQYGANGFRLTFDSSQTNAGIAEDSAPIGASGHTARNDFTASGFDTADVAKYSKDLTATGGFTSGNPATNAFDGTSSSAFTNNTAQQMVFAPADIPFTTNIQVLSGFADNTAAFGSNSAVALTAGVWTTIFTGSGTINASNTITVVTTDASDQTALSGIRVDGTTLIDNTNNDIDFQDTPTSNYATYNPIINNDPPTLGSANLAATGINNGLIWATQNLPNKHLYAEFIKYDDNADRFAAGVANANSGFERGSASDNDYAFMIVYSEWNGNNSIFNENTTATQTSLTDYVIGDVLGVEWRGDLATRQVNFYINGTQVGNSENVADGDDYYFAVQRAGGSNSPEVLANFGQMPFLAAPAGVTNTANGMQTNNLTTPTIKEGKDHMEAKLYEGTGVANTITGMNFAPDLIWIKGRTTTDNNVLVDTIRGTDSVIFPNSDDTAASSFGRFTNFNSDGFTVATTDGSWNTDDQNYVAWCWKAGTSFTPTVTGGFSSPSAFINTTAGFGMYKVTGSNSQGSFTTGLNQNADFILAKRLDTGNANWGVYHRTYCGDQPSAKLLHLNNSSNPADKGTNIWIKTDTTIEVGSYAETGSNGDYIYYVWHEVPGYSSIGGYTGNNDSNGTFVYTGFKVGWLMMKETGGSASWYIYDSSRQTFNPHVDSLQADVTNNETTDPPSGSSTVDFLSNGFKQRQSSGGTNSAQSYVYVAFAESPFGGSGVPPATSY